MNVPYLQTRYGGKPPARVGLRHPTIAPYGAYSCGDGKAVLISIQNEREWVKFCDGVLERPEIATDPRFDSNSNRVANRAVLDDLIAGIFAASPRDALSEKMHQVGIANGRVSTMEDLAAHPQNRYVEVDTPSGPVRLSPGAVVDGALPEFGPVPALGAHTDAVRAEFTATPSSD